MRQNSALTRSPSLLPLSFQFGHMHTYPGPALGTLCCDICLQDERNSSRRCCEPTAYCNKSRRVKNYCKTPPPSWAPPSVRASGKLINTYISPPIVTRSDANTTSVQLADISVLERHFSSSSSSVWLRQLRGLVFIILSYSVTVAHIYEQR